MRAMKNYGWNGGLWNHIRSRFSADLIERAITLGSKMRSTS